MKKRNRKTADPGAYRKMFIFLIVSVFFIIASPGATTVSAWFVSQFDETPFTQRFTYAQISISEGADERTVRNFPNGHEGYVIQQALLTALEQNPGAEADVFERWLEEHRDAVEHFEQSAAIADHSILTRSQTIFNNSTSDIPVFVKFEKDNNSGDAEIVTLTFEYRNGNRIPLEYAQCEHGGEYYYFIDREIMPGRSVTVISKAFVLDRGSADSIDVGLRHAGAIQAPNNAVHLHRYWRGIFPLSNR